MVLREMNEISVTFINSTSLSVFKKTMFNLHLPQLNECQVNKAILIFKETIYLQKKEKTPCRHLPTAQLT